MAAAGQADVSGVDAAFPGVIYNTVAGNKRQVLMRKRLAITFALLVSLLWPQAASAATITVNTTSPNAAFDGSCSLIEAMQNADHGTHEWTDCAAGTSGADVINLASGATYTFTGALTGAGTTGAIATPVVTTPITINGNNSTITRTSTSGLFRYFYVFGGNLTLNDLTVTNAQLPVQADGTIYNDDGTLTINRSTLFGNGGNGGGAVTNRANGTATATLTVADSVIRNNSSSSPNASYGSGAGVNTLAVENGTANTTITNTRITANVATNQGAGVSNGAYDNGATSTTTITRSSITGNNTTGTGAAGSSFGGGIANFVNIVGATARMTVTNTTVSNNAAQNNGYGGALFNEADCGFGAPSCGTTSVTLENVTLAGDSAGTESSGLSRGGGIWSNNNGGGSVTTTLKNTLLSGNTNGDCRDVTSTFVRQGYSIASDSTCGVNQFTTAQIKLGALDTSGQTYFQPLQAGSAAIDKVATASCSLTVDQIGTARPFGSACDVGAIESTSTGGTPAHPPRSDFDGDGRSDAGIFRPSQTPNGLWYAPQTGGGAFQIYFGASGDIPVPADYDGDGKADAVIYRPSTGLWYGPRTGAASIVIQMTLGQSGDIPVPCDYNGDGAVDPAIFRPSTGLWYGVKRDGSAVVLNTAFGQSGDIPVPADYDGDGKCDPGIFRPSVTPNALWYSVLSGGGVFQIYFGASGDIPVAADYDGDGKADAAIFRPASGLWYGPRTGGSTIVIQMNLGQNGDVPIPTDYDGDGAADAAIYRPSTGLFYGVRVANGAVVLNTNLGHAAGDVATTKRPSYSNYPF
jgi:hypothetical protein